ncbi:MAG: SGNH/GDSL hydrolase family protein [Prevotella sp.]|nr:SGNH/GDSL hydrolase family protein [Prevotella sp.]
MKRIAWMLACLLTAGAAMAAGQQANAASATGHWVGTWGTAPQLVESHNNPPSPGLGGNSLRQIVQVSIGGERVRLKLTNEFSNGSTEIKAVELAYAKTAGSSSAIDESSTVSLTFNGNAGVTIPAKGKVTSDPVDLHLDSRQNVAITIHYGSASSTNVSGHPGSRTTSYLKSGNTTDFSGATTTDHWYNILALEVEAPEEAGAVAILGNSITDGRGSTTNQQNRWADVLSRRLLANEATSQVGVLNMGIGGNCVLGGGLGPTGASRYQRDLLGQEGVKWIILFEAVNDLGGAQNGVQTAKRIIDVYKQIIREAHQKGIRVFGGTITPFKGNSYYSEDHEKGRSTINKWIRTTQMLDGVIDFDLAVRNPDDTIAMQSQFLFENDWLHLNAKGYETMGGCVDLELFTKTGPLAADDEEDSYGEALWIEAESLRTNTVGTAFQLVEDGAASGGKYLMTVDQTASAAPADSAHMLVADFSVKTADTYYIYARVLCPTWDDDSYWVGVDGPMSNFANGLQTTSWDWKELFHGTLQTGQHQLLLGGREDGACLDKLCIAANAEPPTGMGGSATATHLGYRLSAEACSVDLYSMNGIRLTARHATGPCIELSRAADGTILSRKIVVRQ